MKLEYSSQRATLFIQVPSLFVTKKNIVTLITCADGGKNRWAIRGNLIKTEKANNNNLKVFKLK